MVLKPHYRALRLLERCGNVLKLLRLVVNVRLKLVNTFRELRFLVSSSLAAGLGALKLCA